MSIQKKLNRTYRGHGRCKGHHVGEKFLHRHRENECRYHLNHVEPHKSHVIVDYNDWIEARRIYSETRTFWQRLKFLFMG
jgi:hypothetical protein